MYKDIMMKTIFHKERIIKEFIKKGIYPDDKLIADRLDSIDTALALFKHTDCVEEEYFDTYAFTKEIELIYKDLEILYKLLYDITANEMVNLKAFVDTHLDQLESTAIKYKLKAEQEANSTSLGRTILFKHNSFNIYEKDNITIIDLGTISLNKGSRIACFADINNIESENIMFRLSKGENILYVAPYNYNQDSIIVPGELNMNSYTTNINPEQIINGPIEMNLDGNDAIDKNSYIILGGKNKIMVKSVSDNISQYIKEKPEQLEMSVFNQKSYIDFYTVGAKNITFRFNKKPVNTNFSLNNYTVSNLNYIHHFFIECDEDFAFDFNIDSGNVYAIKENGAIENNKLYFSRSVDIRDFYVEEYETGEPEQYNAFIKIINNNGEPIDIESVTIKELIALGGDIQ